MDEFEAQRGLWLQGQRGRRYQDRGCDPEGSPKWDSLREIVKAYIEFMEEHRREVTTEGLMEVLESMDRGYRLSRTRISHILSPYRRSGRVKSYQNGFGLIIDDKRYESARAAARALGVSPQTVLNRISSKHTDWKSWRREG